MQSQEFKGEMIVVVEPPQLKSEMGGASKHHQYRIHGSDEIGEFQVWRRYSDFLILKQCMTSRWPGVYIPALPQKKFLGNSQNNFVDTRRQGLEQFLKLIGQQKYLWYGDEFQLFIKSKNGEVDKFLGNLGKTNNRQIATKYRIKFANILDNTNDEKYSQQSNIKISQFRAYLKSALIVLEKMVKVSDMMAGARMKFNEKYQNLLNNMLVNYEQKCVSQYTNQKQNLWFLNAKVNGLEECETNLFKVAQKNPLNIVNQLVKQEVREILNFQQILKNKEEFQSSKLKAMSRVKDLQLEQSKINAGKQSFLSKIKSTSKQQQLLENRKLLQKAREDLKDAEQICKVIDKIITEDQISKFKNVRQGNYYKIVKDMAKAEKQIANLEQEFWGKIAGNQGFLMNEKYEKKQQKMEQVLYPMPVLDEKPKQEQTNNNPYGNITIGEQIKPQTQDQNKQTKNKSQISQGSSQKEQQTNEITKQILDEHDG